MCSCFWRRCREHFLCWCCQSSFPDLLLYSVIVTCRNTDDIMDVVYWDFQQIIIDHLFYDFLIAPRMCFLNSHYLIWFVFNVYLGSLFLSYSANWKFTKMTLSNFNFVRKFEYKIRIKIVHTHLSLHFFLFTLKKCCCSMPWLFFIFWFFTFNRYANAIPIPK